MSPRPVSFGGSEFDEAIAHARAGRTSEALREIERRLAESADREAIAARAAAALAEIGQMSEAVGDLVVAERAYTLAVGLRPTYADLHYQRGCLLAQRQRRAEARQAFDRAIELNPRYVAARVDRAMLDAREGRVGEALDALAALERETAFDDPTTFQQGLRHVERADWDGADALLRRALRLSDPELQRRVERVQTMLRDGDTAQAARALREILPRYEAYPDLHDLLGLAELRLAHYDDALMCFARALELNPDFHTARVHFAAALDALGQTAETQSQLEAVLAADPANTDALDLWRVVGLPAFGEVSAGAASRSGKVSPSDTP